MSAIYFSNLKIVIRKYFNGQVFLGVFIGSMSLGQAFPNLESFSNARAAAQKIYEIIDLHPVIDVSSKEGLKLSTLKGVIEFKNVEFRYPARTDVQVRLTAVNGSDPLGCK